jgi:hypothetical protein
MIAPASSPDGLVARRGVRKAALAPACAVLFIGIFARAALVEAQAGPPLAPTLMQSSVGTRVSFTWVPNPQGPAATAFFLYAGSGPGVSNLANLAFPANQTSFAIDAPPGTYYVSVVALNPAGASAPSNEVIVVVTNPGCTLPGPPTGVIATPSAASVTIRWNSPASGGPPASYAIDVGSGPGLSNLGTFALPNSTTLTAPAPAGQYYVRIRALNACGSSPPSAEVSFVVGGAAPILPVPPGVYDGTMSGNVRAAPGRPPITSFQLTLNQTTPTSGFSAVSGRWSDNAGCVRTSIFAGVSSGLLVIDVEALTCNDGDMVLRVTSITGNTVQGTCNGGPACRFSMTRR